MFKINILKNADKNKVSKSKTGLSDPGLEGKKYTG